MAGLIPIVSIIVGTQFHNINKADKIGEQALNKRIKAYTKEAEASRMVELKSKDMEESFKRLAVRKKAILSISMEKFLALYEKIMKINWTNGEGILELETKNELLNDSQFHYSVALARNELSKTEMICRYVVSPLFVDGIMDAKEDLALAKRTKRYADVEYEQALLIVTALDGFIERANLLTDVITKLNVFMTASLNVTEEMILQKGGNHTNYSSDDKKKLMACVNIAVALKQLLDVPVLDEDSELTKESMEAIKMGNMLCEKLKMMN
jgi:hypothetical protein